MVEAENLDDIVQPLGMVNQENLALYPSILIEYGYMSRGVAGIEKYKEIRETRLELKKKKDKRQLPLKIVLNY